MGQSRAAAPEARQLPGARPDAAAGSAHRGGSPKSAATQIRRAYGDIRHHHRGRGVGRLRAGQPPEPGPGHPGAAAGGRRAR
ncbi:hypothetical protein G6F40_018171 [Rhizopus arrhizus]|nr:hypothetical protein G6F40_018171 [Rhizopus arrhizus]